MNLLIICTSVFCIFSALFQTPVCSFRIAHGGVRYTRFVRNPSTIFRMGKGDDAGGDMKSEEKYRNAITGILSNFMQEEKKEDPLAYVDFGAPKLGQKLDLETLAAMLDYELYNKEWFVTGNVSAEYFADSFQFQDPDVQITGIEEYARGVYKLFDQDTSRAEIISTVVNTTVPNTITCTWRLSGKVKIGPGGGLQIKPYIVYTDFTVDPNSGLVVFQEDRFGIPGWDILLSALFPFLVNANILSQPAPPVEPRKVIMPSGKPQNRVAKSWSFGSFLR